MKKFLKKLFGFLFVVLVIVLIFYFSKGFGLGGGRLSESADKQSGQQNSSAEKGDIPDVIVIKIEEDQVYINGEICNSEEELRSYVEDVNNDTRTFKLEENQSILATHEWVVKVFRDLNINLVTQE